MCVRGQCVIEQVRECERQQQNVSDSIILIILVWPNPYVQLSRNTRPKHN